MYPVLTRHAGEEEAHRDRGGGPRVRRGGGGGVQQAVVDPSLKALVESTSFKL